LCTGLLSLGQVCHKFNLKAEARNKKNKKTRRVVMRCGLLSLGQVCPTFRFTNLISKS
jgi:hypothetical protein